MKCRYLSRFMCPFLRWRLAVTPHCNCGLIRRSTLNRLPPNPRLSTLNPQPSNLESRPAPPPHGREYTVAKFDLIRIWEGYHESRRRSRDTHPESCITKSASIRRQHSFRSATNAVFSPPRTCGGVLALCAALSLSTLNPQPSTPHEGLFSLNPW